MTYFQIIISLYFLLLILIIILLCIIITHQFVCVSSPYDYPVGYQNDHYFLYSLLQWTKNIIIFGGHFYQIRIMSPSRESF